MSNKVALIVDADTIAFSAAAVCEEKSVEITHLASNRKKIMKSRTEFKEFLEAKDFPYDKTDYKFVDIQDNPNVTLLHKIIKNKLDSMQDRWMPDKILIYVSGDNNIRDSLPLPSKYKSNRANAVRPLLLKEAKEYLVSKGAIRTHGEEPDDAIIYNSYEYQRKGWKVIVGSYEKDSKAYSGLELWDYNQESNETLIVPKFGSLSFDTEKKKTSGNGFIWWAFQQTRGDISDGYTPYEIAGVRFGDKTAYDLLKDCKTEQEALEKVIQQYKLWYPNVVQYTDWTGKQHEVTYKEIFSMYFKACRMKETKDDQLNAEEFCRKYGVEL